MNMFEQVKRQEFRTRFQPSRIVLGVFPAPTPSGVNIITLCFDMYCSYKPPMMAFSVMEGAYTLSLLKQSNECVLSIPGERLAKQALLCGTRSGRDFDKVAAAGLTLTPSECVSVPSIQESIANVEMRILQRIPTGDHLTVIGEVLKFGVDPGNLQRCLLSVGPEHAGYEVLARSGIHRIGVVAPIHDAKLVT